MRRTSTWLSPHIGDALVWLDQTLYDRHEFRREHVELVVWVSPTDPHLIETIGGGEYIQPGQPAHGTVRLRGRDHVDFGKGAVIGSKAVGGYDYTKGLQNGTDHWVVYGNHFIKPINASW
ncbi:hypothetical protein [Actinopolymorpha rutila]|uniref:Uncharacterized protein n=1 Tax=Actinopolymorpha rutila TaxID=446787 RepID=A0A852ZG60_9ACTN|nr:hypothetical protein [Actinopolymorpha rutila]NYH91293.1 hypothetical protein [Actinopolymorpha rutila]